MSKVVCCCKVCGHNNWIRVFKEERNTQLPEHRDLKCGACGAVFCAKNRDYRIENKKGEG